MLGLAQLCTVSAAVRSIPQHPQFRLRDKQQTVATQKKNNDMWLETQFWCQSPKFAKICVLHCCSIYSTIGNSQTSEKCPWDSLYFKDKSPIRTRLPMNPWTHELGYCTNFKSSGRNQVISLSNVMCKIARLYLFGLAFQCGVLLLRTWHFNINTVCVALCGLQLITIVHSDWEHKSRGMAISLAVAARCIEG